MDKQAALKWFVQRYGHEKRPFLAMGGDYDDVWHCSGCKGEAVVKATSRGEPSNFPHEADCKYLAAMNAAWKD